MDSFSENDLELVNALQIAPRLPWTDLANVLGSTPITLSKRWEELTAQGLAWISARGIRTQPGAVISLIDLDCLPERQHDLITALCLDPRVVSLEESVGASQLRLTVMVPRLRELTMFLSITLGELDGIRSMNSRIVTGTYKKGDEWRLDSLDPTQVNALEKLSKDRISNVRANDPRDPSPILNVLERNGRAGAAEIAREIGRDASAVQRQINGLLRSGSLSFRCDIAQSYSGWPVNCTWYAKIPHDKRDQAGAIISSLPRSRMCLSITGEANLVIKFWARSIDEIPKLERLIESNIDSLILSYSGITLRTHKRMGWLLDEEERSTGVLVPVAAHP